MLLIFTHMLGYLAPILKKMEVTQERALEYERELQRDLFYVDINKEKIFTFFMSTFLLCVLFFFFSINSYLFQKIISTFQ